MYRYDIQGLRAISVFLVIFYHLKIPFFEGGYIGVDLFFIISGYIITKKIHDKLKSRNFNLPNFFIERLRKIAPPLIITIFFTIFLSYFFLLPEDFSNLSKSIFSNFLFLSNIYFNYFTSSGYFATDAISKPLLHTWSISVEVQFYIFVSISLLIISKFFKNKFLYFFLIIFLISLVISTFIYLKGMVGTNFYQLPFRLFEFSLGSICVYLKKNKKNNFFNIQSYQHTEFFGVFLIILSLIVFKKNLIPHPSVISLLPLLGVFLILFFNDKKKIKTNFLSNKILVYIGTISYSLFLVHYPLVSIANFLYIFNHTETKFLIFLISIFLSILLYHNIEKKFTKKKLINNKKFFLALFFSLILITSFCYLITKKDSNNSRFPKIFAQKLRHIEDDRDYALKHLKIINNENNKKIFLIGDSHAGTLKYNILNSSNFLKYNVFSFTNLGLYMDGFEQYNRNNYSLNSDYIKNNDQIRNFLINNKNLIVIISQRWSVYINETYFDNQEDYKDYNDEKDKYYPELYVPKDIDVKNTNFQLRQKYILKGIEKTILDILNLGHKVILVYPIPDLGFDAPKITLKKYLINKTIPILSTNYNVYKNRNYLIIKLFDNINHKNLYKVFPDKFFCDTKIKNRCLANTSEDLFYYDKTHLSLQGSKFITNEIMDIIKKIND